MGFIWYQGRSQDFLKGGSRSSIELPEAGVWGLCPQLLRNFQYFNESNSANYYIFCKKHISAFGMKLL